METKRFLVVLTLLVWSVFYSRLLVAEDVIIKVDINVMPGDNMNVINSVNDTGIPLIIFGSARLDVKKIDPFSLVLGVHFYWPQSFVKGYDDNQANCEIWDLGSYSKHYEDQLGPVDGYDDLLCQFGSELAMIQTGGQSVTLTGVVNEGFALYETLIFGLDAVNPATKSEATVRCCISCDDEGQCQACSHDIYQCDDYLRVCTGEPLCQDCGNCKPPNII